MSEADTAEYQLSQLAALMTEALAEAEASGWRNDDYREGFQAAFAVIANDMGLKPHTTYTYLT
jgi:hypothetical protein